VLAEKFKRKNFTAEALRTRRFFERRHLRSLRLCGEFSVFCDVLFGVDGFVQIRVEIF